MGSNPKAVSLRVLTKRLPGSLTNAPVSFACKIAGLTNACLMLSPVSIISDTRVAFGAGGSILKIYKMRIRVKREI